MDETYAKIAASLNYPDSELFLRILKKLMTPEEGRLILSLPLPATDLAARFNTTREIINSTLKDFWFRGLVASNPEGYAPHSTALWLHDWTTLSDHADAELLGLWKDFYEVEWAKDLAQELAPPIGPPMVRLVPSPQSLDAYSANTTEPVLPHEDPRQIVAGVDLIGLRNQCICRKMTNCGHPVDTCLQFNQHAEEDIARSFARKITVDEAVSVLNRCAENGLVHFVSNKSEINQLRSICNCCVCACIVVNSASKYGTLAQVLSKTRYEATVDTEACTGCELCLDQCNFDALEVGESAGSQEHTAQVDPAKCWGCGACYTACASEAISLKLVRPVSHIPATPEGQPSPIAEHL